MESNTDTQSNDNNGQKDLLSAFSYIEALQKQLAEKNTELSEVRQREEAAKNQHAQLNDVNEKLREWIALGMIPSPGPDVLKRMSNIRVILMAFIGTALKARGSVVDLTGDDAAESKEITPATVVDVIG